MRNHDTLSRNETNRSWKGDGDSSEGIGSRERTDAGAHGSAPPALMGKGRSAAVALEEGADGQRVAPTGESGGRALPTEMMVEVGSEQHRLRQRERDGDVQVMRVRPQVGRRNGASTDAVVAASGTMVRRVRVAVAGGALVTRLMTDLVCPAEERAGQQQERQECRDDRAPPNPPIKPWRPPSGDNGGNVKARTKSGSPLS